MLSTGAWAVPGGAQVGAGAADVARKCTMTRDKSPDEIVSNCTKAIESTAWHGAAWAYVDRAAAYIQLNQIDLAFADLDRVIKYGREGDPAVAAALQERCEIGAQTGRDLQVAHDDCSRLLVLRTDDPKLAASLALVDFRMANYAAVLTDCGNAISKSGAANACLYVRGVARLKMGDASGGRTDVETAKTADPAIVGTYAGFGVSP